MNPIQQSKNLASTAFHAQELGFRTILVDDCSRGIKQADIEATKEKIKENNGCVIHSSEVSKLIFLVIQISCFDSNIEDYKEIIFKYLGKIYGTRKGSTC